MISYVARRLLASVPTLLGVATLVFLMVRLLPGDPAFVIAGPAATPHDVDRIREQLGLNLPVWQQYLLFMAHLVEGNLGISARSGQPVTTEIASRLPFTVQLAVISMILATVAGVGLGLLAATRHNSVLDLALSAFAVFGVSMPVYWLGMMLVIVFAVDLRIFPPSGAEDAGAFVLPSVTLALFSTGLVARQTRSAMLEVLGQDYIRTAVAKGAGPRRVVMRHAFRNALLPIITTIGLQFGALLGGAVLTETVFGWPGIGRLLVDSIFSRDFPVVQGIVLLLAASFVAVNLVVDVLYAYVDPRIRYG